jgi:Fic family protein
MRIISDREIKYLIHQSNLIEGFDDKKMDEQGLVAWRYLVEDVLFDQLDHHCIQKVQKIITLPQNMQPHWRGYYRSMSEVNVTVGGRAAPGWWLVDGLMANWCLDYPELDSVKAHVRFEHIHPFVDGNGRTGRLLMWWMQMHRDEPLTKITYARRQNYYEWFK